MTTGSDGESQHAPGANSGGGGTRPPLTGDLQISALGGPMGSTLGLTNCPGRCRADRQGRDWRRDLNIDLDAIEAWGADVLVSLVEAHEFETMGVADLKDRASARRFRWHHLPIEDFQAPGPAFHAAWAEHGPSILFAIERGGRVVIHCAAGLGRTGTFAAALLIRYGETPDDAIAKVRATRPGAIESAIQERFLRDGGAL